MNQLKDLDVIALTEDMSATHFETGEPITLCKGQVGTIVMVYDDQAFEVEFANNDGTTYAMEREHLTFVTAKLGFMSSYFENLATSRFQA
jgi:preprotein translocase subunit YajC